MLTPTDQENDSRYPVGLGMGTLSMSFSAGGSFDLFIADPVSHYGLIFLHPLSFVA
jgi:hypothetical protein